jgi:hypothetical protein
MFCRSLFVLLSFFFWQLCCLSFSDSDYPFGIKLFLLKIEHLSKSDKSFCDLSIGKKHKREKWFVYSFLLLQTYINISTTVCFYYSIYGWLFLFVDLTHVTYVHDSAIMIWSVCHNRYAVIFFIHDLSPGL